MRSPKSCKRIFAIRARSRTRGARAIITAPQATAAYDHFLVNAPRLADSSRVWAAALQLALAHRRTAYDCLYLALALDRQCDLVTADEEFFLAVHQAFPFVRLLV